MDGRVKQRATTAWAGSMGLLLLALLGSAAAYQGFDCGQGTALLMLASHSQCGSSSHLACFTSFAMRVRNCNIKAWPHQAHKHHKPCMGIRLLANVTDVNTAHGTISGLVPGSSGHVTLPVSVEFRRPDEAMHVRYGECTLRFDVHTASDASLRPVPGEDEGGMSSLLVLLLPAILVPCMCVGLVLAVGSINAQRMRAASPAGSSDNGDRLDERLLAAAYGSLPGGLGDASSGAVDVCRGAAQQRALGLITRSFNLKAMSRRAQARRLRRSARPVYVGLPQECAVQQQMYATGTLQPGPTSLVAPCFRFPPVTMSPGLESIAEACTPCSGCSAAPSRSSSCQEMLPVPAADLLSPASNAAVAAGGSSSLDRLGVLAGSMATHSSLQPPPACCDAGAAGSSLGWSIAQQLQQALDPTWLTQLQQQQQQQQQQQAGESCDGAC